ncbi:uncharacterized protein VNE69_03323 [Vairimorpha necatrix]|uniref:Uncharacterized protein n=1 Tax=Vairimorpha necatrix TaxID=6039 RepID=A0AAX4JAY8_9MICR
MFFYFVTAICSEITEKNTNGLSTNEISAEKDLNVYKNINTLLCHGKKNRKDIKNYKNKNSSDSGTSINTSFNLYKKRNLTTEYGFKCEKNESKDFLAKKTKIENANIISDNRQFNIDQTIFEYRIHIIKIKELIVKWDLEDINMKVSRTKIKFVDKTDYEMYRHLKQRINKWIIPTSTMVDDLLLPLDHLIVYSDIDIKTKQLLFCKLEFCYEAMIYVHKILPTKENNKQVGYKQLSNYKDITKRFPVLFFEMGLKEVFHDFIKTFRENYNPKDLVCIKIVYLLNDLEDRLNMVFNGFDKFIKNIISMSKLLYKLD